MADDIVTRLVSTTEEMTIAYYRAFPTVVTLEDAMRQALEAADEIERLREQIKAVNLEWRDLIDQTQAKAFAEIERLRAIIRGISDAVTIEGRNPAHHRSVVAQVQTDWPWFWSQIQVALKEVRGE